MKLGEDRIKLYEAAKMKFGADFQIQMAIEEMAELIVALRHYDRNRCDVTKVAEKIADVSLMMEQLSLLFCGEDYITKIKKVKLKRLYKQVFDGNADDLQEMRGYS